MRITYILNCSDFMGDANVYLLDLAHGARRASHDVTILVGRNGVFFKSSRERGISCFPLKHIERDIELVSDPFETWLPKGYWDSQGRSGLRQSLEYNINILATGGAGFIGSKVVSESRERGMNVRISPRKMQFIVEVDCVRVGLLNGEVGLDFLTSDCTVILSCLEELQDENKMHALHIEATERLIIVAKRSARQSGMPVHWVQLSNVGAYDPIPKKTNSERIVTEEAASAPVGAYGCTKTVADELVIPSVENGIFSYSVLRPSSVYGSGMPNGSLRQQARLIEAHYFFYVGPPGSVSTYVHVGDVVKALLLCAFEERTKNQIFDISNDCTQESLVGVMAGLQGASPPFLRFPEALARMIVFVFSGIKMFPLTSPRIDSLVARTHYSCNKLNHILGYVPSRGITKEISEVTLDKEGRRQAISTRRELRTYASPGSLL